jgi:spore coat protein U-like protein
MDLRCRIFQPFTYLPQEFFVMRFKGYLTSAVPAGILGILAMGLPHTAAAATATAPIAVTATVQATCIVSTTAMSFGTYTGTVLPSTSTVTVQCTNTTPYTLGLNAGVASGATVTNRSMTGPGSALLNYGLYTDSGHATNFATLASTNGTGSPIVTTIYGQVAAGQYVAPGAYTDTITATVTY